MNRQSRRVSLKWKIYGSFGGLILLLGIGVIAAIYQLTGRTLREQLDQRALAIATNLSDAAAGHIIGRNFLALHALATKYALLDGVAYAFIEDDRGEIVAQTLGSFPPELQEPTTASRHRQVHQRELSLRGKAVYETSVPVLEGQVGSVHVGFWGDAVGKEIRRALLPVIGLIAILVLFGALLSVLLARGIIRPILHLTKIADKMTMGDLETAVDIESRDEIGDLARSLERMRSSLKAAMLRLSRQSA